MEGKPSDPREVFANFLKKAYAAYIVKETRRGGNVPSQTDFAKWLGVTQTSFSNWINAVRPPEPQNLDAVATKLGPEVYDIFGIPPRMPKDPVASKLMKNWHKLTPAQQRQLAELADNFSEENEPESDDSGKGGFINRNALAGV